MTETEEKASTKTMTDFPPGLSGAIVEFIGKPTDQAFAFVGGYTAALVETKQMYSADRSAIFGHMENILKQTKSAKALREIAAGAISKPTAPQPVEGTSNGVYADIKYAMDCLPTVAPSDVAIRKRLRGALHRLDMFLQAVRQQQETMDRQERPPTGDDYNTLADYIRRAI